MDQEDLEFDNPEALLDPFGGGGPDPVDEAFATVAKGKEEEDEEGEDEEEEEEDGDPMTAMSPPRPAAVAQKAPAQQQQQQQPPPPSQGMVREAIQMSGFSLTHFEWSRA